MACVRLPLWFGDQQVYVTSLLSGVILFITLSADELCFIALEELFAVGQLEGSGIKHLFLPPLLSLL